MQRKFTAKITPDTVRIRQGLPLDAKIILSQQRIRDWYEHYNGDVYISFSGGKDSTVLLDLVREIYPHIPAVFVDTGLEYPEIKEFVKTIDNVIWIKPKYTFKEIIDKYGYPIISKEQASYIEQYRNTKSEALKKIRWEGTEKYKRFKISEKWKFLISAPFKISDKCCKYLKKSPLRIYEKETGRHGIIGIMSKDSNGRSIEYQKHGCNAFGKSPPVSWPIAFWTNEDIWQYIRSKNIKYCSIYDTGIERTGCIFCMFGLHMQKVNRFEMLKKTHRNLWEYCVNKLKLGEVLDYIGLPYGKE
jgi:3'-phosphoadenosine 5'-phosphosulfate sulfotransferase (PAPS reductase)/FAD synthetase